MAEKSFRGYLYGAAAAVSYGLNPTFALPLYADGMNTESVLLLRYVFAILIVAVMMKIFHRRFTIKKDSLPSLLCLGIFMAASSLFLFISYNHMAAGIASTILFVYPIFVAVIMALVFKEKFTFSTFFCLATAVTGILLLYNTGDGTTLSLFGTAAVILSAISYAVYLVWAGKGKIAGMSSLTLTFYVLCFGTLLFIAPLIIKDEPLTLPSRWYLWFDAFALALFPTPISLLCTKLAISIIGSTPTAILGALEPVTAVILGIILFGEGMTLREAAGIVLILLAVTIVVSRRSKPAARTDSGDPGSSSFRIRRDIVYSTARGYWSENFHSEKNLIGQVWQMAKTLRKRPLELRMDVYSPAEPASDPMPTVILLHGGSFYMNSKLFEPVNSLCRHLASNGYVAFSINYRMGFRPTKASIRQARQNAVEDAASALDYIILHAEEFGIDPGRVAMGGSSSGAITSLALAYSERGSRIKAVINMWGGIDNPEAMDPYDTPLLSFHGDADTTVPYNEGVPMNLNAFMDRMYGSKAITDRRLAQGRIARLVTFHGYAHAPQRNRDLSFNGNWPAIRDGILTFLNDVLKAF